MKNFLVVGEMRAIVAQVLLAIHDHVDANCSVVSGKGTRSLRLSRLCTRYIDLDFYGADDQRFVDFVRQVAATDASTVVVPADCQAIKMVNRVRAALPLAVSPAPDAAMLALLEDKWSFYQFCKANGLSVPETVFFATKTTLDFDATVSRLGLPFVVKPLDQVASYGVEVIRDERQFRKAILNNDRYHYAPLIAQRFIAGTDIGLNLLAINGSVKALACQEPHGTRVRFFPSSALEHVARVVARQSGYHGVMNIDARIEDRTGTIFLFEANPRVWRSHYASVWCGLNFCGESLRGHWPDREVLRLSSGTSDVYYHPLFRPSQWRQTLSERSRCGRMLRIMLTDPYTFTSSIRPLLQGGWQHLNWMLLRRRVKRVY